MFVARHRAPWIAVLTAAFVAAVVAPSPASAAVYQVQQCHSGSGWATDGIVGENRGFYTYFSTSCGPGGNLGGSFDPGKSHEPDDYAYVSINAATGTSLDSITATRDARAGTSQPYGTPLAHIFMSPGGVIESYNGLDAGTAAAGGTLVADLQGASGVAWGASCAGYNGCVPSDTHYILRDITIGLRDTNIPTLSQVTGNLRSESGNGKLRSLTFVATDAGGGVFRQRLIIDGSSRAAEIVDPNGGRCALPFSSRVPCQREVTGTATLDTGTLPDGRHEVALDVRDATDQNRVVHGPWTITVDNQPPAVGSPTLTGVPRERETLTCTAAVAGQSPSIAFQWLRTQSDGSGTTAIAGATNPAYAITAADVGHKLLCRVTAADGGGTTTRETTITQSPFDEGRTIAGLCSGRTPAQCDVASASGAQSNVRFLLSTETATFVGRRARWSRSAFKLRGRLTDPAGASLPSHQLSIIQTVKGRRKMLGTATTGADGTWSFQVPRGPNRSISVTAGEGPNAATMTVQQRVIAHIAFRAVDRRLPRGGRVLFRGQLRGGYTNTREKLIEFQVHYRGAWRTIATLRTDRKGRFSVRYRFASGSVGRYTFRARTLPTDGYPFSVGTSRGRAATVRVG